MSLAVGETCGKLKTANQVPTLGGGEYSTPPGSEEFFSLPFRSVGFTYG